MWFSCISVIDQLDDLLHKSPGQIKMYLTPKVRIFKVSLLWPSFSRTPGLLSFIRANLVAYLQKRARQIEQRKFKKFSWYFFTPAYFVTSIILEAIHEKNVENKLGFFFCSHPKASVYFSLKLLDVHKQKKHIDIFFIFSIQDNWL